MLRKKLKWKTHKSENTDAKHRGGVTCSSDEIFVMGMERRGYIVQTAKLDNHYMGDTNENSKVI